MAAGGDKHPIPNEVSYYVLVSKAVLARMRALKTGVLYSLRHEKERLLQEAEE